MYLCVLVRSFFLSLGLFKSLINRVSSACSESKKCPSESQVASFIKILSELLKEEGQVAVHCHYGFNRTGFLIVCFLVEAWNMSVQDAIRTFSEHRSPGIKHEHFTNELIKRYGGRKK